MESKETCIEWFYKRILANDIKAVFEQAKELHKQEQDEFAIGFAEWLPNVSYVIQEAYTTKELLEIYKKEKGL